MQMYVYKLTPTPFIISFILSIAYSGIVIPALFEEKAGIM